MRQYTKAVFIAGLAASLGLTGMSHAATITAPTIDDVDLTALAFDIQNTTQIAAGSASVDVDGTTTSINGTVGWSLSSAFGPLTDTTSLEAFNVGGSVGNPAFEHVHISGEGTVFTFDTAISDILFFVENDNSGEITGLDLGIEAVDYAGATIPTLTAYAINTGGVGAYLLYQFMSPVTSVTSSYTGTNGGFDAAFFANVLPSMDNAVPLPAAAWMFLAGLGGTTALRRRKTKA